MHQYENGDGEVIAMCDATEARQSCLELLAKIHEGRLQEQIRVVSLTAEVLQADADRRNRWRRWIPFIPLAQAPSLVEIHNELQQEGDGAFAQIQAHFAEAEKQALDTVITSQMQDEVAITITVLRAMSALEVGPPRPTSRKLSRIGF